MFGFYSTHRQLLGGQAGVEPVAETAADFIGPFIALVLAGKVRVVFAAQWVEPELLGAVELAAPWSTSGVVVVYYGRQLPC